MDSKKKRRTAAPQLTEKNVTDDFFWFFRVAEDSDRHMISTGSYYVGAILNRKIVFTIIFMLVTI